MHPTHINNSVINPEESTKAYSTTYATVYTKYEWLNYISRDYISGFSLSYGTAHDTITNDTITKEWFPKNQLVQLSVELLLLHPCFHSTPCHL